MLHRAYQIVNCPGSDWYEFNTVEANASNQGSRFLSFDLEPSANGIV